MQLQNEKKFVVTCLVVSVLLSFSIITLNWLVDPFEVFDAPKIGKFNEIKTALDSQQRLTKAVGIARLQPKVLLLGSSRVLIGLDPQGLERYISEEAYNAGFHGANFEEIYSFFEHARYHQPRLKMVVVGLDFFAFNENRKVENDFLTLHLKEPALSFNQLNSFLFTKSATFYALDTIKNNFLYDPQPVFKLNGHSIVTSGDLQNNPILVMGEREYLRQLLNSRSWYKGYQLSEKRIELFHKLAETCRSHGIALHVFINPCKAIYWESLFLGNLWGQMEIWKRKLCAIHPVWDFSGFNAITAGPDSHYFDCSHYTPEIGDLILASFFGGPSFGYRLTPENVDAVLTQIRLERELWFNQREEPLSDGD